MSVLETLGNVVNKCSLVIPWMDVDMYELVALEIDACMVIMDSPVDLDPPQSTSRDLAYQDDLEVSYQSALSILLHDKCLVVWYTSSLPSQSWPVLPSQNTLDSHYLPSLLMITCLCSDIT